MSGIIKLLKKNDELEKIMKLTKVNLNRHKIKFAELHNDKVFQEIFELIGNKFNATSIVETGAFLGWSSGFFANKFPNLQIYTCEIVKRFYNESKKYLIDYKNINLRHTDSLSFLNELIDGGELGECPVFFLDAHWYRKDLCLTKEIELITNKLKKAVIIVDDFKIPGNSSFGFEVSLETIKPHMNKKNSYKYLIPHYNLGIDKIITTGYSLIFQNIKIDSLLEIPFIKKNFREGKNG